MFNPLNDPQVQQWFRRFDIALMFLSAEERASSAEERAGQRREILQHLESLAAANEEMGGPPAEAWHLALTQFGDPTKIGRKISLEWQQARTGSQADTPAIRYAVGRTGAYIGVGTLLYILPSLWLNGGNNIFGSAALPAAVYLTYGLGGMLLGGVAIGRGRPYQAIKAAFYASLLWSCYLGVFATIFVPPQLLTGSPVFVHFPLLTLVWALGLSAIAYLASVTKRGWYRPSLADFKFTLSRKQQKLSH